MEVTLSNDSNCAIPLGTKVCIKAVLIQFSGYSLKNLFVSACCSDLPQGDTKLNQVGYTMRLLFKGGGGRG